MPLPTSRERTSRLSCGIRTWKTRTISTVWKWRSRWTRSRRKDQGIDLRALERVPRLYTLVLTFTGVPADDLRPDDIDLVFVNTVTGKEVEARRVASHDVGDTPSWERPTALPPAPAVEAWVAAHPYLNIRQTDPGNCCCAWYISPFRTPRSAARP